MATLSVVVGVRDLERELKFYSALGFTASDRTEHSAIVALDGARIELHAYETLRVRDAPLLDWERHPDKPGQGIQLYLELDDVDRFAERIPLGVARPWPVQDKPWGMRELTLRTPSGYLLTFGRRRR